MTKKSFGSRLIVGGDATTQLPDGTIVPVVRFNNGATTPPFVETMKTINDFMTHYSAFLRGGGPLASKTYDKVMESLGTIKVFLGASSEHSLLFTQNSSAGINWFVRLLGLKSDDVVLATDIEHTSNNLPWSYQSGAKVVYVESHVDGSLNYDDLEAKVKRYAKRLKIVTMTGASNMSGFVPSLGRVSRIVKAHSNAQFFVDAAQLAPHREIKMARDGVDGLVFSAHKLYAPFGLGVLVVLKELLAQLPVDPGGGSIDMLSGKGVVWAPELHRHQTGTWNVTGIIATAASCKVLQSIGFENLIQHEQGLAEAAVQELEEIEGVEMFLKSSDYAKGNRTATIPFNIKGYHHALGSAILGHEYGIETRSGTICSHRLVRRWLDVGSDTQIKIEETIQGGDRLASYGVIRVSLGCFNTCDEIKRLIDSIRSLVAKGPACSYDPLPEAGMFLPA